MNDFINKAIARTGEFEGFRADPYVDTVGKTTIGFGLNLENSYISPPVLDLLHKCVREHVMGGGSIGPQWKGLKMSRKQGEEILKLDLNDRWWKLCDNSEFTFVTDLPDIAQLIMLDMSFNLGLTRLRKFKKFLTALEAHDWKTASVEMLDSLWARQVKRRATSQAAEIRGLA